jgi:hypothetical protein
MGLPSEKVSNESLLLSHGRFLLTAINGDLKASNIGLADGNHQFPNAGVLEAMESIMFDVTQTAERTIGIFAPYLDEDSVAGMQARFVLLDGEDWANAGWATER